jgi:hypothetical protein
MPIATTMIQAGENGKSIPKASQWLQHIGHVVSATGLFREKIGLMESEIGANAHDAFDWMGSLGSRRAGDSP